MRLISASHRRRLHGRSCHSELGGHRPEGGRRRDWRRRDRHRRRAGRSGSGGAVALERCLRLRRQRRRDAGGGGHMDRCDPVVRHRRVRGRLAAEGVAALGRRRGGAEVAPRSSRERPSPWVLRWCWPCPPAPPSRCRRTRPSSRGWTRRRPTSAPPTCSSALYAGFPECGASVPQPCRVAVVVTVLQRGSDGVREAIAATRKLIAAKSPEAKILVALQLVQQKLLDLMQARDRAATTAPGALMASAPPG